MNFGASGIRERGNRNRKGRGSKREGGGEEARTIVRRAQLESQRVFKYSSENILFQIDYLVYYILIFEER